MMVIVVKCNSCGYQLVLIIGEGGLEAEVCSICGANGEKLELVGSFDEMAPDTELIAEILGIGA